MSSATLVLGWPGHTRQMLRPALLDKVAQALVRHASAIPAAGTRNACAVSGCLIAWRATAQLPSQSCLVQGLPGQNPVNPGVRAGTGKARQSLRGFSLYQHVPDKGLALRICLTALSLSALPFCASPVSLRARFASLRPRSASMRSRKMSTRSFTFWTCSSSMYQ